MSSPSIFPILDIEITLRCNGGCRNCIKFCGMEKSTGMNYRDLDMDMEQIKKFISQVKRLGDSSGQTVIGLLYITGGEPLLHPKVVEIVELVERELLGRYVAELKVNTNLTLPIPAQLQGKTINFSTPAQNWSFHDTALVHPDETGQKRPDFISCRHYRKNVVVLGPHGYSICCAGDGYIRLFGLENLFVSELPDSLDGFPLKEMDEVCQHCPFGCEKHFAEAEFGAPVSEIYRVEADKNRMEYRIKKKF